jgi:hypothetical protein
LGLATQVPLNITNTTFDNVLIGYDVSAFANHEASTGFIDGFGGLRRRGTRAGGVDREIRISLPDRLRSFPDELSTSHIRQPKR